MKYLEFFKMLEADKSRFINKLDTAEENKQLAIDFFKKHPNYESEINWQSPDLSWEDIEEVIYTERISGAQLKNFVKKGTHFLVLYSDGNCALYQPLTWLSSRYLASTDVKPKVEGEWCISYQKDRGYWDRYSLSNKKSFIILCTPTTKYALEISPRGTIILWDAEDNKLKKSDFYNEVSKEIPNIENLLQKYVPIAMSNHSLVEQLHKKDLEECDYIEKVKEEEKQHRIKIFPKSFKRQVRRKGYYNWDGDITYEDLKNLGLVDEQGKVDERFKYFKISGNLYVSRCPITSITLPDGITKIVAYTFSNCSSLTSVIIPDSVTYIEMGAFLKCTSLTSINIPDNVTKISHSAFADCSSLTKVYIPDSVTYIGDSAFYGCSSLTEITIPDSVTSIDGCAFENCSSLTSITIPDNVTKIGQWAFRNCSSLVKINIPDSVTSIGYAALGQCSSLTEIAIPDNVTSIDSYAFHGCSSLKSIVIPNSVTKIGWNAFESCSSLTEISISENVPEISRETFRGCSALTSINIPDSVTRIDGEAFAGCSSLKRVLIPNSVTEIGDYAFYACSSLKSIYIDKEKDSLDLSKAKIRKTVKIYWRGEF